MTLQQSNESNEHQWPGRQAQIELEQWCVGIGGKRATAGNWIRGADGFMSHAAAGPFLQKCHALYQKSKNGPMAFGAIWALMEDDKAVMQVAAESLIYILNFNVHGAKRNTLAATVGKRAEFVLWLNHPQWKGSRHLKGLRLANGRTLDMSLIRKRLIDKGFKKAAAYQPLSKQDRLKLGTLFVELVAQTTGLLTIAPEKVNAKGHIALVCRMTPGYWEFLRNWKQNLLLLRPAYMPMLVPPSDYTTHDDGGFITHGTTCSTVPWERWDSQMRDAHPCVLGSINYLQSIPFRFNHEQIALQREVWDLGHEIGGLPCRERMEQPVDQWFKEQGLGPTAYWTAYWKWKADGRKTAQRTQFIHGLISYERLKDAEKLYWVWFQDNRGRCYQRGAQLNYLGGDVARSQILFDRAAPMKGNMGAFLWALGDAWGLPKNSSVRQKWAAENGQLLTRAGIAPLDCLGWWEQAKEPWRFIALARELTNYAQDNDYKTRMVFQLDQTCSGYGHVACLLRDGDLAFWTNVIGDEAMDLYGETKEIVDMEVLPQMYQDALNNNDEKMIKLLEWWGEEEISRSLMKLCVMPVIYGRSYRSMVQVLEEYCRDRVCNFLTPDGLKIVELAMVAARAIDTAVKKQLPGVDALHRWLRTAAKACLDSGMAPYWQTPNGLTVLSYSRETSEHKMFLELSGRAIRVACAVDDGPFSPKKSFSRLTADYVHSMDAAFLQRFIWHWKSYDYPIVTVHDCIGTSLDKVILLNEELCDQFSRFYSDDHLAATKARIEKKTGRTLPKIPCADTLELSSIGENCHLFC